MSTDPSKGKPGKPGRPGSGSSGGAGGEGGVGGLGYEVGGAGGAGGTGGVGGIASGKELKTGLRNLGYATVALFLVLAILGTYAVWDSRNQRRDIVQSAAVAKQRADQTTHALCTLRGDLVQRINSARVFLRYHPHGIPGISPATLRSSISNQQRTITSLGGLQCKEHN